MENFAHREANQYVSSSAFAKSHDNLDPAMNDVHDKKRKLDIRFLTHERAVWRNLLEVVQNLDQIFSYLLDGREIETGMIKLDHCRI